MGEERMQIGEVAERTGLSLRTIRYYGEVGLVEPSARSKGGFRLYTTSDVERLLLIKRMKPLEFSLEEMCDLLATLDELAAGDVDESRHAELLARLDVFAQATEERCRVLRERIAMAEEFGGRLQAQRAKYEHPSG